MAAPRPLAAIGVALAALASSPAGAADLSAAELKRGLDAVGLSTSEAPAVRAERASREPSAGFMLGAALGSWTAARDQLDFDLEHPQAAGAPHASQGPANLEAIDEDCREERVAFERLQSRAHTLGLEPLDVLALAGASQPGLADAWRKRAQAGPSACAF